MSTEVHMITVSGLTVEIVRKDIKNLHLGVYPPAGRVRIAAPLSVSDEAVRLAVVGKLGWIKRQKANFEQQPRESSREMVSGESHYFLGHRYRLRVIVDDGTAGIVIRNKSTLELHVRQDAGVEARRRIMSNWYRKQLKEMIPPLLEKWQKRLGVEVLSFGIKRMKTKWGTCTADAGRIWINLELAKKYPHSLEYVVVHELVHLIARHHDDRFVAVIDKHLPGWRARREELNYLPLSHESWRE